MYMYCRYDRFFYKINMKVYHDIKFYYNKIFLQKQLGLGLKQVLKGIEKRWRLIN